MKVSESIAARDYTAALLNETGTFVAVQQDQSLLEISLTILSARSGEINRYAIPLEGQRTSAMGYAAAGRSHSEWMITKLSDVAMQLPTSSIHDQAQRASATGGTVRAGN